MTKVKLDADGDPVLSGEILDVTAAQTLQIHNGQAGIHQPVAAIHKGLYHLAARRKLSCMGGGPHSWTATSNTLTMLCNREYYSAEVLARVWLAVSGGTIGDYLTVDFTTSYDATGQSATVHTTGTWYGDHGNIDQGLTLLELKADFAAGTKSDITTQYTNAILDFTLSAAGPTVRLWSYQIVPLPMEEITL